MAEQLNVVFEVETAEAEERLIREYIGPAFDRIDQRSDAQWPIFNRYGQDPSVETGELLFIVFGECASIARDEKPHWNDLIDAGLLLDWEIEETDNRIEELSEQERYRYRQRTAASRMSLEFFELFDPLPEAFHQLETEEYSIGWDLCLHHIINQLGYQANCSEEEVDILFQCLVGRFYAMAIAPGYGAEFAESKIEELIENLQSLPAQVREFEKKNA